MTNISWKGLKLVIFDVDGTLYRQSKLRRIMLFKLLSYYSIRPWKYKELLILHHFRLEREKRSDFTGDNLQEEQYSWCAVQTNATPKEVKKVVDKWIFNAPNKYLKSCLYPGVAKFFDDLKSLGIKTAVYSDYDATEKLKYMGLQVDLDISSTDARVNAFKPMPNGLNLILDELQITQKNTCLFIGDRFELDGRCAERAGIPFVLVDKADASTIFYPNLSSALLHSTI